MSQAGNMTLQATPMLMPRSIMGCISRAKSAGGALSTGHKAPWGHYGPAWGTGDKALQERVYVVKLAGPQGKPC